MSLIINIDRFTRLRQSIDGKFLPHTLPRLAEFLAGEAGVINYSVVGNLAVDAAGSQECQVKCIIYGWFLLSDPVTLAAVRYPLDINSSLILVKDETDLPPLEMESDTVDYIVCGTEMDLSERIEEEILLSLPAYAVNRSEMIESREERTVGSRQQPKTAKVFEVPLAEGKKISPFAKLAELKKK